jgi:rubrerythrin
MVYYRSGEILNVAIQMEIAGRSFYQELQKKTEKPEKRNLFAYLADEEQKHRELFEQLKKESGVFRTEFGYDLEDYHMGLSLLEESAVFRKDEEAIQMAKTASSAEKALDAAIRFEKDSILYYQEMRPIVAPKYHGILDRIINEEKLHFRKLSEMRKGE